MVKKIIYILLILIVMFSAMYSNSNELYIWFYIVIGVPLVSFLLLFIATLRLKYTERIDDNRIVRGESIQYRLNVYNEDFFLYPFVQTNFFLDSHIGRNLFSTGYFFLFPKRGYTVNKDIRCIHTGGFHVGVKEFEVRDFFGFFTLKTVNRATVKYVYVLPKIHHLAKFANVQGNIEERVIISGKRGALEDYTEIESIDEYRPGIPYKKIHWKATAAKAQLMVKEFAHPNDISVCMYVDINTENFDQEVMLTAKDIVLESSLSIARYCVRKNITYKVMINE